jgi:hypothetical protein
MHENLKQRAVELYESGMSNIRDIARKMYSEEDYDKQEHSLYMVCYNAIKKRKVADENPGLFAACEESGVPIENVKHGWYKGKHWSIAFKQDDNGPTFDDMLNDHLDAIKNHTFKYEPIQRTIDPDGHLLVVDPADVHIGKLSTVFATGKDYNNQIAVQRVKEGVRGILEKASGFQIEKILFVAGNDILHIDTPKRTTTSGTPQDTDGMWYDNFLIAKRLYIEVLEELMKVADVHFVFNPSNHDYTHGFFLADAIQTWFKDCQNITFDSDLRHRKYFKYGKNLIGTTHGDGAKQNNLGELMSIEATELLDKGDFRYWYLHHYHHKMSKDTVSCTIETLRTPSEADRWHADNGYMNMPAIEGFIHSREKGQIARLTHFFPLDES